MWDGNPQADTPGPQHLRWPGASAFNFGSFRYHATLGGAANAPGAPVLGVEDAAGKMTGQMPSEVEVYHWVYHIMMIKTW